MGGITVAEASCHAHMGSSSQHPSSVGLERGHQSKRAPKDSRPPWERRRWPKGRERSHLLSETPRVLRDSLSLSLPGIPGQMLLSEAHWGAWLKKRSPTCILSLATISTRFASPPSHLQQSGSLLRHLNGEWTMEALVWKLPGNPLQRCLLLPLRTREQDSGIRWT